MSRTAPAAVTHDWSGWGDRKNTRAGNDVWLSSTSTNHRSHRPHTDDSPPTQLMRAKRSIMATPDGGDPARTSSRATSDSRVEKAEYRLGR